MSKKYSKAISACNKRDSVELSWELIRVALQDLDDGVPPELGKTVIIELVKTVSAGQRTGALPAEAAADADKMKDWLKG